MRTLQWLAVGVCLAAQASAADVKFMYLAVSSRPFPGLPPASAPAPDQPAYGISVFLDSDNPAVNAFRVSIEYRTADGSTGTQTKTVARDEKHANVAYSTLVNFLIDSSLSFVISRIEVAAEVARTVAVPMPGLPYAPER